MSKKLTVLAYHSISNEYNDLLTISPKRLEKHIIFLIKKQFEIIDIQNIEKIKKKSFVITFDDGFEDFYINGFKLLKKYNISPIIFICPNLIGNFFEGKKILNINQIKELSNNGVIIGSHSLTHKRLTEIENKKEMYEELYNSKKKLEDLLTQNIDYFCPPYNCINHQIEQLILELGYKKIFISPLNNYKYYNQNPNYIVRTPIYRNDNNLLFRLKLTDFYQELKKNDKILLYLRKLKKII